MGGGLVVEWMGRGWWRSREVEEGSAGFGPRRRAGRMVDVDVDVDMKEVSELVL